MATDSFVPPGQIDRSAGDVNPSTDPGIYVPPGLPNPSIYGPARIPAPATGGEPILVIGEPSTADNGPTNIVVSVPTGLSVSENGNIVVARVTDINFTGLVNVTADQSIAVISIGTGGNWGFYGDTLYNLNGGQIENGDLSHGATSRLTIPPNGSGNPMSLLNYYGNITITPALNPGNTYQWVFDRTGNLVMPTNTASINYANGQPYGGSGSNYGNANVANFLANYGSNIISTTGNITSGTVTVNGSGGDIVMSGGDILGANSIYLGNGVFLGTVADNDSVLWAPYTSEYISLQHGGNIFTGNLQSNVGIFVGKQSEDEGPNSTPIITDTNLVQIMIREQPTLTANSWFFFANSVMQFPDGTHQTTAYTGGGGGGNITYDTVTLSNLVFDGTGPVVINSGNDLTLNAVGQTQIISESNTWLFDTYGALTLPNVGVVRSPGGSGEINVVGSDFAQLQWVDSGNLNIADPNATGGPTNWIYVNSDGAYIETNVNVGSTKTWYFDNNGNMSMPNGGYINFVNTGGIKQAVNKDFYVRGSDNEDDGWSIYNVIDDGAGNDLTKTQLQYNRFSIYTDVSGNNYSFDFREGGEFDVPKSIRGPVGGNLVISIGDQPSSNTFIDLQTRSYVGDGLISNIRIANPNVTVSTSSGAHTWTFDGTGQMTLAGTPAIVKTIDDGYAFSGFISGISLTNPVVVTITDNVFGGPESGKVTIFNVNGTTQANGTWYFLAVDTNQFALYYDADQEQPVDGTGWTAWTSGGQALAYGQHDMTLIGGNIMLTADQNGVARDFSFANTGNLTLPISGKIVGATANNNGYLNWVGNSSGDGGGYTTLRLVPDDTRESADQYLIIDPTAPGHIHIRAGGQQDNSSADLFLGGENSYFKVNAGANNEVRISANSHAWVFGADSVLTVPGEGVIRSIQDTVILQSYDISGNTYSARLGTTGGLYFETTAYPLGWLNLTNNEGNANLSSPGGSINIDSANGTSGAAGKDINITAGDADQSAYYTTAGGEINIQGGMGAFNDGGGGGPGGNVNLVAGTSADPAGHAGNINITAGTNAWTFDYSGAVNLPGGTGVIESYANNISIYSDAGQLNGALFYDTGAEVYALQDFAIFTDNANASHIWRFYANAVMSAPGNIATAGNISASGVITSPVAFASLTAVAGARAFINDGNLVAAGGGSFGAQVSGGGSNICPVWSDGSNWYLG